MLPDCNLITASRDDIRRYSLLATLVSASPIVTADDARQLTMSLSAGFSDASMQLENDLAELNRYQLINGDLSVLNTTSPTPLEPISVSEKGKGLVRSLQHTLSNEIDARESVIGIQILNYLHTNGDSVRGIVQQLTNGQFTAIGLPIEHIWAKTTLSTLSQKGLIEITKQHQGIFSAGITAAGITYLRGSKTVPATPPTSTTNTTTINFNAPINATNFVGSNSGSITQSASVTAEYSQEEIGFFQAVDALDQHLEGYPELQVQLDELVNEYKGVDTHSDNDSTQRISILYTIKPLLYKIAVKTGDQILTCSVSKTIDAVIQAISQ